MYAIRSYYVHPHGKEGRDTHQAEENPADASPRSDDGRQGQPTGQPVPPQGFSEKQAGKDQENHGTGESYNFV